MARTTLLPCPRLLATHPDGDRPDGEDLVADSSLLPDGLQDLRLEICNELGQLG